MNTSVYNRPASSASNQPLAQNRGSTYGTQGVRAMPGVNSAAPYGYQRPSATYGSNGGAGFHQRNRNNSPYGLQQTVQNYVPQQTVNGQRTFFPMNQMAQQMGQGQQNYSPLQGYGQFYDQRKGFLDQPDYVRNQQWFQRILNSFNQGQQNQFNIPGMPGA